MRWIAVFLAAALAAGCLDLAPTEARARAAIADCRAAPATPHVLYFGPSRGLQETPAPSGSAPGNAFSSAFLTNDLKEWLSAPVPQGLWLTGNVTLEFWARSTGTPAPMAFNPDFPGQGYHFFNQFGSDRSLQPAAAFEYSDLLPPVGKIDHYTEQLPLSAGGFVLEAGDRVRVLLTDLALDSASGGGHDILFGGDNPSQVRFEARCWPTLQWTGSQDLLEQDFTIPANQGLLVGGQLPAATRGAANQAKFPLEIPADTQRLTIKLQQGTDANPVKDDVDINLLDRSSAAVYSIGSPYSDEAGTLWVDNLQSLFPGGGLIVEVDSYSGVAYMGHLSVIAETATLA